MTSRRQVLLAASATVVLAGCDRLGFGPPPPRFRSIDITGVGYARDFRLKDPSGQERTLADFKGKVVAVFFGFTQCPDVCPTSLTELTQVKQALGPDGDRLQGVFITVDPERDTPPILKEYMAHFDPSFVALRGTPEETAAVAKEFKVYYAKVPGKTPDTYTMDHTAGVYLFDPAGQVRLFARHGQGADALVHDIRELLRTAG